MKILEWLLCWLCSSKKEHSKALPKKYPVYNGYTNEEWWAIIANCDTVESMNYAAQILKDTSVDYPAEQYLQLHKLIAKRILYLGGAGKTTTM